MRAPELGQYLIDPSLIIMPVNGSGFTYQREDFKVKSDQ